MKNLIDIAKECGASECRIHEDYTSESIVFDDIAQLRATVEQVAGPLVEALMGANQLFELMYGINEKAPESVIKCREALAAYTEIMEEKK